MPKEEVAPFIQEPDLDDKPFILPGENIADTLALSLVNKTFTTYESYRTMNHDRRFTISDYLYFGWLPAKTWEGTTVPRATLGVPIVFDQVETALPLISAGIFGAGDDWFSVQPENGVSPQEAQNVKDYLSYIMEHPNRKYGAQAQNELELSFKDIVLYGNGGVHYYWDEDLGLPQMKAVDIRDFYIDPGATSPSIADCRSVIWRKEMTVTDLLALKDTPGMSIPSEPVLNWMSKSMPQAYAERTKRTQEAFRQVQYSPGTSDYLPNPADRKIEVLVYYSNDRIIWALNRAWVAFNQPNPYGCIPFDFAPCYSVPGRWYAQSMADVNEGNQRYMESLLNARLDEVNMALHPPRIEKRSTNLTPTQQRWRPGGVISAADPKDVALLQPQSVLTNVYSEIQFIQMLAEKRTGINSMGQGIPRPGNANRTATGINAQMQGSASRLTYIVKNIENYLIVPMLYKLQKIAKTHSEGFEWLPAKSNDRENTMVPAEDLYKKYQFRMFAASKMMTREKLAGVFPFLAQYMLGGPFMAQLSKSGQTVDFNEFLRMLQDSTGVSKMYTLVRPMNEQEKKQASQPPPEVQAQQQKMQADMQMAKEKNQTTLQVEQIKKQPTPQEDQREQQKMMMEMELDKNRLQSEQMLARIKQQAEIQSAKIKAEIEMLKMNLQKQKSQVDIQTKVQEAGVKQQLSQSQMEFDRAAQQERFQSELQMNKIKETKAAQAPVGGAKGSKAKKDGE